MRFESIFWSSLFDTFCLRAAVTSPQIWCPRHLFCLFCSALEVPHFSISSIRVVCSGRFQRVSQTVCSRCRSLRFSGSSAGSIPMRPERIATELSNSHEQLCSFANKSDCRCRWSIWQLFATVRPLKNVSSS